MVRLKSLEGNKVLCLGTKKLDVVRVPSGEVLAVCSVPAVSTVSDYCAQSESVANTQAESACSKSRNP